MADKLRPVGKDAVEDANHTLELGPVAGLSGRQLFGLSSVEPGDNFIGCAF